MSPATFNEHKCTNCGAICSEGIRNCHDCNQDLGFPNVRLAENEGLELEAKYSNTIKEYCKEQEHFTNLEILVDHIKANSNIVVATPSKWAQSFLSDKKVLYNSYDRIVASQSRVPSSHENDSLRLVAGSKLFGSFHEKIIYGVLALNDLSLQNYGDVFFSLKKLTIEKRVSFLIKNSYHFLDSLNIKATEPLPKGFRATWLNKEKLVILKLANKLTPIFSIDKCCNLLVTQGANRSEDDCIEAHIYEGFTNVAIQRISFSQTIKPRDKKVIVSIAKANNIGVVE